MTNTIGDRLRDARARFGMSQVDLGRQVGLSDAYVSLIESGKRSPSAKALAAMAVALDTTAEYLAHGDGSAVEAGVSEAIRTIRSQLAAGFPAEAEAALASIDPEQVSHVNRLGYLRAAGLLHDTLGDIDASIPLFEQALVEARKSGTARDVAEIGMWLTVGHQDNGALDAAVRVGQDVLGEVEAFEDVHGTDEHLRLASTLLWAFFQRGDHMRAKFLARKYSDLAEAVGTARGRGSVLWNAALIMQHSGGDQNEAVRLADAALQAMLEGGSTRDVPRLRYDYATILLRCSPPRPVEALEHLEIAEEQLTRFGSKVEVARCQVEKARARMHLGDLDGAEEMVTRGLADLSSTGTLNLDTCNGFTIYGDLASLRGDMDLAFKRYGWAAERLAMMSAGRYAAEIWAGLAQRLDAVGRPDDAVVAYRNALDVMHVQSFFSAPTSTWASEAPVGAGSSLPALRPVAA